MGGNKIDGRIRATSASVEQVGRGGHAPGKLGQLPFVAFPERPHIVAKAVIPLSPARREAADLIASGAAVPRLGNQLDLTQQRVLAAGHQKAVALIKTIVITAQNGRQIEPEAIDVHLAGPVAQRVGDHLQDARVAQVEGVAGARIVDVEALVIGHQPVIRGVVDAAHGQGRALFIALGGVVVNHVQNHFQPGFMQVRDHFLELGNFAAGQVARVGREKAQGVVAPVVGHAFLQQVLIIDETVDRQQLDTGHAQVANMFDHLIDHQPGKGPAHRLGHRRVAHADTAHMGFVEDRALPRHADAVVMAPGVGRVDDFALGHKRGAVALVKTQVGIRVADGVAKQRLGPFEFTHQLLGIRVDEQFMVVETVAVFGVVRAVHAIAVDLPRVRIGQVAMEGFVGVFRQFDAFQFDFTRSVEQTQFNLGGVGGKQREIDPQSIPSCPQREGQAFSNA